MNAIRADKEVDQTALGELSASFKGELVRPGGPTYDVNFLMDEGEGRVRDAYGVEKYERLKSLKRTYDPDNFFHLNQNIPPA